MLVFTVVVTVLHPVYTLRSAALLFDSLFITAYSAVFEYTPALPLPLYVTVTFAFITRVAFLHYCIPHYTTVTVTGDLLTAAYVYVTVLPLPVVSGLLPHLVTCSARGICSVVTYVRALPCTTF